MQILEKFYNIYSYCRFLTILYAIALLVFLSVKAQAYVYDVSLDHMQFIEMEREKEEERKWAVSGPDYLYNDRDDKDSCEKNSEKDREKDREK